LLLISKPKRLLEKKNGDTPLDFYNHSASASKYLFFNQNLMPESETEDHRQDIPASLTIVNEATPLLSHSIANSANRTDANLGRRSSTLSLSGDHARRKKEIFGLLLMTLSALGFSVMSLCVKLGGTVFPSFEMVFARSLVQLLLGLLGCAVLKVNPFGDKKVRGWLVLRGLAGSIGLALFFYSLTVLPLADATGKEK
jgi:hypothetical protein